MAVPLGVAATMMGSAGLDLGFIEGKGWQAVDLPYVGSDLAMAIVLPEPGLLPSLEKELDERWLRQTLTGFSQQPVRVQLPRWTFRFPVELASLLARLGMPTAFTSSADFTGMSTAADLFISRVVHEAFIAVDEYGTEAAAATAVVMERTLINRALTVDRPFLYIIHDVATATPLFVGRILDPTAER